jgi:hypothetical protein
MEKFEVQSEWSVDGIKELQSNEKEELVNVLDTQERGVNSDLIDLNNFSDLWVREWWNFHINEKAVYEDDNGEKYIILDGERYYEKWEHPLKYMKIYDDYWMCYFYLWEVNQDWTIEECHCLVIRNDWWIFKWEWNKKGILKDPNNWEYDWNFVNWKPIDVHSRPTFHRKWVYKKKDWTVETYVAYASDIKPQFISWKDYKEKENRGKHRWSVVSIKKEYQSWEIEHVLHSWKRETSYTENEDSYVFRSKNGKELKLPKYQSWPSEEKYWKPRWIRWWEDRAKQLANLLNAIEKFVCLHPVSKFVAFWSSLQVKYRDMLLRKTMLKNVEERVWVSSKDLADWLNDNHQW